MEFKRKDVVVLDTYVTRLKIPPEHTRPSKRILKGDNTMSDITLCKNQNCPIKNSCLRFITKPINQYQSYATFQYDKYCDYFWNAY